MPLAKVWTKPRRGGHFGNTKIYYLKILLKKDNYTAKTLVLKVAPLVSIEDHTKWVLSFNTKITPPNTSLVLFNTLGVKIKPS